MFTGAVDRALKVQVDAVDREMVGRYLANAELLEQWITDLRALAFEMLNAGATVPGYKLVAKKGRRQWLDEQNAVEVLLAAGAAVADVMDEPAIKSPAQVEKALKARKLALPDGLAVSVSSGSTLAPESDPRPPVLLIGQQLTAALSKLS